MKPFSAPRGLPDPFIEEMTIREPMPALLGCQTGETAKARSHLHPKYKQVKDIKPLEGTLSDHTRLSILSRNVFHTNTKKSSSLWVDD